VRLTELEPEWVDRATPDGSFWRERDAMVEVAFPDGEEPPEGQTTFVGAQGIWFLCPKGCGHRVLVWFKDRGVPGNLRPSPRWIATGASLDDLTTKPSIQIVGGCAWHGFITNGEVTNA